MTPRREEIEAAVAAHNASDREPALPPAAVRLLAVMFPSGDVCRRSAASLVAETGDRRRVVARLLYLLMAAGFLSQERGRSPNVYWLHLPPLVRR